MSKKSKKNYEALLAHLSETIEDTGDSVKIKIREVIDGAKKFVTAAEQMSADEAALITESFKRDLQSFKESYQEDMQHSLWLDEAKHNFWRLMYKLSDHSKIEWYELSVDMEHSGIYRSGELVGLGNLVCTKCGCIQHLFHPTVLTDCIECGHNEYVRKQLEDE